MRNKSVQEASSVMNLDVVDLILIDHRYMKECIEILTDAEAEKVHKITTAKGLFSAYELHSEAERKSIYQNLREHEELHFNVLEAEVEHNNIDEKMKVLQLKIQRTRILKDELEAELKVFADMIRQHLMEEESEVLPRMREYITDDSLKEMGQNFMKMRKFTIQDLMDYPQLHDELIRWKDSIQKISSKFLTKMDKVVESLQH